MHANLQNEWLDFYADLKLDSNTKLIKWNITNYFNTYV